MEGLLIAAMIATSLSGCASPAHTESVRPLGAQPLADVIKMSSGLYRYMEITGHPPASKKDLQRFCANDGLPCERLDWSKFSWRSVDGNNVTVTYKSGGYSASVVVGKDSVSVTDTNAVQDEKLKEQLEKLMDDPKGQP
jgi:hypothetical protein